MTPAMPEALHIAARLRKAIDLSPVLGAEIEWYLRPKGTYAPLSHEAVQTDTFLAALHACCEQEGIPVEALNRERGPGQVETAFPPTREIEALASHITRFRQLTGELAEKKGLVADFSAKPYPDTYGNGLHLHVHLEDAAGYNAFWKQEDALSDPLRDSLAGLLAMLPVQLPLFAPHPDSYARFEKGFHAPVMACWGGNNRTVALRLPDAGSNVAGTEALARLPTSKKRRIEHRVAGSDADIAAVITAILEGIWHGVTEQPPLPPPIHGDAGDPQYHTDISVLLRPPAHAS